jgi:hypothetical protein
MKSKWSCLAVFTVGLLTTISVSFAQQTSKAVPSAAELKRNITTVSSTGEDDGGELVAKTARQVVAYLKNHELSAAEAQKLGLYLTVDSKDAAHLRVYSFNYHSGGTRGTVNVPVIQWKNQASTLFAYAPDIECAFNEIHKLNSPSRTLYLLLGNEQGSSICVQGIAYVIELKGNYLLLDTPAFDKSASLAFCNITMEFDDRQQVLRLDATDFDFDYYTPEDEQYKQLARWGLRPSAEKPFALKFDGQRFGKN